MRTRSNRCPLGVAALAFGLVALAPLLHGASAHAAGPRTRIALLPFAGTATAHERDALADELRPLLAARTGVALQSAGTTAQHVQASFAIDGACSLDAPACMARIGSLASVDRIVGGRANKSGEAFDLQLVLAGADGRVVRRVELAVPAAAAERATALKLLAIRLLEPEAERGRLELRVRQRGATVVIDGRPIGLTPLPGALPLAPGPHEVWVTMVGAQTFEQTVEIRPDETTSLDVVLVPAPAEQDNPWPPTGAPPSSTEDGEEGDGDDRDATRAAREGLEDMGRSARGPALAPGEKLTVALLGEGGPDGAALFGALSADLRNREGFVILDEKDLASSLGGPAVEAARSDDVERMFALVGPLGADTLVTGSAESHGGGYVSASLTRWRRGQPIPEAECHELYPANDAIEAARTAALCGSLLFPDRHYRPDARPARSKRDGRLSPVAFFVPAGVGLVGVAAAGAGVGIFALSKDVVPRYAGGAVALGGVALAGAGGVVAAFTFSSVRWDDEEP